MSGLRIKKLNELGFQELAKIGKYSDVSSPISTLPYVSYIFRLFKLLIKIVFKVFQLMVELRFPLHGTFGLVSEMEETEAGS